MCVPKTKKIKILVTIIFCLTGLFYSIWQQQSVVLSAAQIIFMNVGQGDSALIITSSKQYILIDGGPDLTVVSKLGGYLPSLNPQIDLMIITHAHADHVVGLVEVIQRYPVKRIIYPGPVDYSDQSYLALLKIIQEKNISLTTTTTGNRYVFADKSYWQTWQPFIAYHGQRLKDLNESSVVGQYCFQLSCALFMGDATQSTEKQMLAQKIVNTNQIIKIGHHGSYYSSDQEFLRVVGAKLAVISVGENKFGHPNPGVLKILKRLNMNIWRTDLNGDIQAILNGQTIEINDH
ncbi:MAG: hypothetical protein COX77_03050 [Candidatus Komeilibacteria bacterium CG_4_10_14_0_2_um_filter_37_10]|uniref:Metallo-beta-lactamase domain-containing protein n=1 Tax=Candidatus Komeilibacteria bacterium CG_4_10_14_0_2_um_filter_37_10 TaxID=1974470 RepID=A0A2M7VEI3_9BACT|nr:MAG: hypothetical protein COX77_03050 [Candidatus Komeilibacteria bacterium CG_4_10_14_0_2_um_filter_37_10]PJA93706.1 MAG: hypothetical protein CO133_01025 [Candidatus Komeilibacteria bacterium CG_4_9_14_3_um_filter_37_5]